jgi:hypothetical protein
MFVNFITINIYTVIINMTLSLPTLVLSS